MRLRWLLILAALTLGIQARADEDIAIVVGVPSTAGDEDAPELKATVTDATDMAAELKRLRFNVTCKTSKEDTTRDAIVGSLQALKQKNDINRFVFYFAGHGRAFPVPGLVPSNAVAGTSLDIDAKTLHSLIEGVQARSRTVILDACHSAALAKSINLRFRVAPSESKSPRPYQDADKAPEYTSDPASGICYYSACNREGRAAEGKIDGADHGVFTHALVLAMHSILDPSNPGNTRWGEIDRAVHSKMEEWFAGTYSQDPCLTPGFDSKPAFGVQGAAPKQLQPPKSLLDLWATEHRDDSKISIAVDPQLAEYAPGLVFDVKIHVAQHGYLVLICKDSIRYDVTYPKSKPSLLDWSASAKVDPGDLPPRSEFFYGATNQQVRAFLFDTEQQARAVLAVVRNLDPSDTGMNLGQMQSKSLGDADVDSASHTYSSASFSAELADGLIGGITVTDYQALLELLRGNTHLANTINTFVPGYVSDKSNLFLLNGGYVLDEEGKSLLRALVNSALDAASKGDGFESLLSPEDLQNVSAPLSARLKTGNPSKDPRLDAALLVELAPKIFAPSK